MRNLTLSLFFLIGCTPQGGADPWSFPTTGPELRGGGGPATAFEEGELFENCASLSGGPTDIQHHNLVVPYRGHLVMPWAPEWGISGGISLFDVSDPCRPSKVGEGTSPQMRETHAMGFVHLPAGDPNAGDWAVVNSIGGAENSGVQFWDFSSAEAPVAVSELGLPDVWYPDSYARISLSVFWQYPYVYVAAADNGVFVVDATDPLNPTMLTQYVFPDGLRAGGVFALGNLLLVTSAEQTGAAMLDISDPADPRPIGGGDFTVTDRDGEPREFYHANIAGDLALFARKESGGGPIIYDISDPSNPTFLVDLPLSGLSGGYIFYDEGFLFVGGSNAGHVIDARDLSDLDIEGVGNLPGDLDTVTPYGNVAILSVDDEAENGEGSVIMPWRGQPDGEGPKILRVHPADGTVGAAATTRIGVNFNEMIEPASAFEGSLRLYANDGTPIRGWVSTQEGIASYTPVEPLRAGTSYRLEVMAGGVTDINGNALAETFTSTFTTAE